MKLVCDAPSQSENVEYYTIVSVDGQFEAVQVPRLIEPSTNEPSNEYGFVWDFSHLAPGGYNIMVSACNQYECSIDVPFELTRPAVPSPPAGLRVLSA